MGILIKAAKDWSAGRASLWQPFWAGGISFFVPLLALIAVFPAIETDTGGSAFLAASMLWAIYGIWLMVCIWRCAVKVNWRGWLYIARLFSVFVPFILLFAVVIGLLSGGAVETFEAVPPAR